MLHRPIETADPNYFFGGSRSSQRTMLANGALESFARLGSVQKQASLQYQRPVLPLRMMCSQVSVVLMPTPVPAMVCGRIASGGMAGGLLSVGRGGGVS